MVAVIFACLYITLQAVLSYFYDGSLEVWLHSPSQICKVSLLLSNYKNHPSHLNIAGTSHHFATHADSIATFIDGSGMKKDVGASPSFLIARYLTLSHLVHLFLL